MTALELTTERDAAPSQVARRRPGALLVLLVEVGPERRVEYGGHHERRRLVCSLSRRRFARMYVNALNPATIHVYAGVKRFSETSALLASGGCVPVSSGSHARSCTTGATSMR